MLHLHRNRRSRPFVFAAALFAATIGIVAPSALKAAIHGQAPSVKVEWFGWSFFRLTSPNGKVILTNPFITGNADASVTLDDITKADLILVPNGHGDEIGDTVAIAKKTGATTLSPFELGAWFVSKDVPEKQVQRRNPGGRLVWEGITIRVVGSVHGSGSGRDTASERAPIYGGVAAGFMITFENGYTVYFPGSSAATQDMAVWGSMYKPDAMLFLMHANGEPLDTAQAIKFVSTGNPNLKTLLPQHHRLKPPAGAQGIADVRAALDAMGIRSPILNQERGKIYEFPK